MNAEERSDYIKEQLKSEWPTLNDCGTLEILIDKSDEIIRPIMKPEIPIKLKWWKKLLRLFIFPFKKLKDFFYGK